MFFLCLGKCLYLSGLIPRPMNADNDRELLGDKFIHLFCVVVGIDCFQLVFSFLLFKGAAS
jgi:hypothetical protein